MKIQIAHIGDLQGIYFNIPDYQRGYRWETKQISELLDDLLEFNFQDSKSNAFYCLQPLVVVKNSTLSDDQRMVYDVIDGQQRLTTMFLIYNHVFKEDCIYHLRYDRASDKNKPHAFENGELVYSSLKDLTSEQIKSNPDFFYLSKAITDIHNWFNEKKVIYPRITGIFQKIIVNDNFENSDTPFYKNGTTNDINDNQKDVRFIWYDATEPNINYNNSIAVFKRLNYGKTSLTSAELIKALLFQCDVYNEICKAEKKQVAFRMSTEWDSMEKSLQDKFLWAMLTLNDDKKQVSHIDLVLSFIAEELHIENNIEVNTDVNDEDYNYIIFNKYIQSQSEQKREYGDIVQELWERIQDIYDIIVSWFKDREIYHLIGLRLTLLNPKNHKIDKNIQTNYTNTIKRLFKEYKSQLRSEFINNLKNEIGKIIDVKRYQNKKEETPLTLSNLCYGRNDDAIVNILLTYNVTLTMKNSQDNQYFPFWFYRKIKPSLEHIHPQHLHDDEIDFPTRCLWYKNKRDDLKFMNLTQETKTKIDDAIKILDPILLLSKEEENKENDAASKSYNTKKQKYETNESIYRTHLNVIDDIFDELAAIDSMELHNIRNMALVDQITNTRLGNSLMAIKRKKLIELQNEFNESKGINGAYTFTGTWKVFNKQFWTNDSQNSEYVKSTGLLFWSKEDRKNYFSDLEQIYKEYIP